MTQRSLLISGLVDTPHIKLTSTVTSKNITSFSTYEAMVSTYFLKTNTVSGYLVTSVAKEVLRYHHLSACPMNVIQRHTLQHILLFAHTLPTYAQTSFRNSLSKNDAPTS